MLKRQITARVSPAMKHKAKPYRSLEPRSDTFHKSDHLNVVLCSLIVVSNRRRRTGQRKDLQTQMRTGKQTW